jgi:hypothetical protein
MDVWDGRCGGLQYVEILQKAVWARRCLKNLFDLMILE